MESGGGSGLMMLGSSYGGEGDQHQHHHSSNNHHNNNSLNMNIDVVNGLSRGSSGGSPHPHAMMMMMPLTSSTTTTTTSFHPYLSHHNDSGHPPNATTNNNLPPLPSPLHGDAGAGSSNIPNFMMLDNNYYNTHTPKSHQNLNPNSNNMMSNATHGSGGGGGDGDRGNCSSLKAKIMAHPHYPRLLAAYVNCQKVGAPPEVVARLEESFDAALRYGGSVRRSATTGDMGGGESSAVRAAAAAEDPSLDQFMEAYCEMLSKYEQELTKPFKEAMLFLSKIESQFKSLSLSSSSSSPPDSVTACGEASDRNGSSEEEIDVNTTFVDPLAEDRELKCQLLRKYSGYLGSLKQEFMKKRKKGKLPKEARQQLLEWWTRHYKWPYPSESQKLALSEATGLDLKQINNWFINQRKRHWKPSEDMQFVVMDAAASAHHHPHYYMDNVLGNPFPMDLSPALL